MTSSGAERANGKPKNEGRGMSEIPFGPPVTDAQFNKTVEPWLDVLEHSGEHYGLLVAYYRANGVVPPESRPKK